MKKIIAIASLSACIASPVLADDSAGFYAAIDTGVVVLSNAGTFPNLRAVSLSGGYKFSPSMAIEIGSFETYDSQSVFSIETMEYNQRVLSVSAVGIYPLNTYFELFGKLGWDTVYTERTSNHMFSGPSSSSATTNNVIYGLGAKYNISKHFGVRAQYESLGTAKLDSAATGADISRSSIGVVYNF